MKKTVTNILDDCQPQELDSLLEQIDADLPAEADPERIKALAMQKAGVIPRRRTVRRIALIAACITVLAGILVGCYVAEKVEYDNAVRFFDLNNLDTDGMSRGDIKRVYRDITTESFRYDDSYSILSSDRVEGVDISITNNVNNNIGNDQIESMNYGLPLFQVYGDIPDKTTYFVGDECEKNANGETVWRTKLPHYCDSAHIAGDRVLVWGEYIYDDLHDYMHTHVALIDDKDGKILWDKTLDSEYRFDESACAVMTDGGKIAVLTLATDDRFSDEKVLVFRELDTKGKVLTERELPEDDLTFIHRMIPLTDGWLAQIGETVSADTTADVSEIRDKWIRLDQSGEIKEEWHFPEQDENDSFELIDIREFDGRIYLSAQAHRLEPKLWETADYDHIPMDSESLSDGFTDELRDAAREDYSSVLFVYDPATDKPERFYSVGGAMAGKLCTDDSGNLVWQVGRIVKCGWAPWASSFQYYGITRRYDYTFSDDGTALREEKTNHFNSFRTL